MKKEKKINSSKKRKFIKDNMNGITLVALVVTIVVLLILAGITITMLFSENGIITKAREAADAVNKAQGDTINGLGNLEDYLSEAVGEYAWKVSSDGKKVVNKNYPEGIEIGSYINYDCTPINGAKTSYLSTQDKNGYADQTFTVADYKAKGWGWRVLGADNKGQLMLISEEVVPSTIADGYDNTWSSNIGFEIDRYCYFISGKVGYVNGIKELNNICDIYGHGVGATGGKLITIEEINKMTGLNENNVDGNGKKYGLGKVEEYGNSVTYYWDGTDKPYYEASNGLKGNLRHSHNNGFTYYDETAKEWKKSPKSTTATAENKEKITTITSDYYDYNIEDSDIQTKNLKLYKTLFTNSTTGADKNNTDVLSIIYYVRFNCKI